MRKPARQQGRAGVQNKAVAVSGASHLHVLLPFADVSGSVDLSTSSSGQWGEESTGGCED